MSENLKEPPRNYRPSVVGVVTRKDGTFLVGERSGEPNAWQFPQGGVDPGESPEEAVLRELEEEIGTRALKIIKTAHEWVSYDFPKDLQKDIAKYYRGQTQLWFLLELEPGGVPNLENAHDEFQKLAWWSLEDIMASVVDWKKKAYGLGLMGLGLVEGN